LQPQELWETVEAGPMIPGPNFCNWSRGGGGISLRFKSSALDFPKDLASGGCLPPPSVGLSFASAERASPRSKSWKIEAPPPSRSEKRRHPVITY